MGVFKMGKSLSIHFKQVLMIPVVHKIITNLGNTCEDGIFLSSERCKKLLYRVFQMMFVKCLFPCKVILSSHLQCSLTSLHSPVLFVVFKCGCYCSIWGPWLLTCSIRNKSHKSVCRGCLWVGLGCVFGVLFWGFASESTCTIQLLDVAFLTLEIEWGLLENWAHEPWHSC